MRRIIIATRGSKLALWQAEHVKTRLEAQHAGIEVELLRIKTQGDKILDVPLAQVGGKKLFVKEIEEALLDGRADLAVHSMKDVPVEQPKGLTLGVIPEREDSWDELLSVEYMGLAALPSGARVGTGSLRRQAQLLALRPDLNMVNLRGNVDTRLRKLIGGEFAAIVIATTGLKRLGLRAPRQERLAPPTFLPAVGQGALSLEYREDRPEIAAMVAFMDHRPSLMCVTAERGFLAGLDGGCQAPIAAWARPTADGSVTLTGLVTDLRGERQCRREDTSAAPCTKESAYALGYRLAAEVLNAGGRSVLAELYERTI
ncbi:hydroxymethylbilane synthase [Desulfovibrionales bacterium]